MASLKVSTLDINNKVANPVPYDKVEGLGGKIGSYTITSLIHGVTSSLVIMLDAPSKSMKKFKVFDKATNQEIRADVNNSVYLNTESDSFETLAMVLEPNKIEIRFYDPDIDTGDGVLLETLRCSLLNLRNHTYGGTTTPGVLMNGSLITI